MADDRSVNVYLDPTPQCLDDGSESSSSSDDEEIKEIMRPLSPQSLNNRIQLWNTVEAQRREYEQDHSQEEDSARSEFLSHARMILIGLNRQGSVVQMRDAPVSSSVLDHRDFEIVSDSARLAELIQSFRRDLPSSSSNSILVMPISTRATLGAIAMLLDAGTTSSSSPEETIVGPSGLVPMRTLTGRQVMVQTTLAYPNRADVPTRSERRAKNKERRQQNRQQQRQYREQSRRANKR